jgi:uncharacterized protein YmfQ (DUF2313 family)
MMHADLLKRLLPPVAFDPAAPNIAAELYAEGGVLDAALLAADQLLAEADPRTTSAMLADWERVYGLPDPCVTTPQSFEQRRAALVSLAGWRGSPTRQFFIDLAELLGYPGAVLDEMRPMTCNDTCNDALGSNDDLFAWRITLPAAGGVFVANCNSTCDSPLASWGDEAVECRIQRFKPAHTVALVAYQ